LTYIASKEQEKQSQQQQSLQPLFMDRKIEEVTAGLRQGYTKNLYSILVQNAYPL